MNHPLSNPASLFAFVRVYSRAVSPRRSGISLMEVLIAIFVLSIGLLGVAAMIPVGRFAIVEAGRYDRASACARGAMSEVRVREIMNHEAWTAANGAAIANTPLGAPYALPPLINIGGGPQPLLGQTLVIDPLQVAASLQAGTVPPTAFSHFPYDTSGLSHISLPRLALSGNGPNLFLPANQALLRPFYNRIFTWHDDQMFEISEDRDQRPEQQFTWTDGFGPPSRHSGGGYALIRESEGHYSWMLTLVPSADETPATNAAGAAHTGNLKKDHQRTYEVSVVVFQQRNFELDDSPGVEKPSERWAYVNILGSGYGGGDVQLLVPDSRSGNYLELKRNRWIMLVGQTKDPRLPRRNPPEYALRTIAKWYRIVAVDEEPVYDEANHIWYRYVTLDGPDWDTNLGLDTDGDDVLDLAYPQAILLDDVVEVHTEVIGR